TKHNAVGVQGVVDREALAQKFRVPRHFDVHTGTCRRSRPPDQLGSGPNGDGRLSDDHRGPRQTRCKRVDYGVDMAQIGTVFAALLRSTDSEEVDVGEFGGQIVVGGEPETARFDVVPQHFSQTGLVEWNVTGG